MAESDGLITLRIVTPFGTQEEIDVRHLRAPGIEGDFGVLPGHIPFLTALRIGQIKLDTAAGVKVWATSGGYTEVLADHVTILAETAEQAEQIDLQRAEDAKKRALQRIEETRLDVDIERARLALSRAMNRMQAVEESAGK